jgi:geranylgeranyl diphosphate synthase, type II
MLKLKEIQTLLEGEFSEIKFPISPEKLYQPIKYAVNNGGKRIRPALTLLAAELFTDEYKKALPQAIGLELFHNFTLLHDDIMDNAEVRRNQPTVHKKWNENIAILSGDAMLIEAYKYISNADPSLMPETLKVFNQTAIEVCEGQQYDMDFESRMDVSEKEYLQMIKLKTAVLLAASLKIGAIVGGADALSQKILYDFGIKIGLGFQLKDDFLDTFGNPEVFGKNIGGDIVSNKKTFLLIKALETSNENKKRELQQLLAEPNIDKKIEGIKNIYIDLGVDEAATNMMGEYYTQATNMLNELSVENQKKEELYNLAKKLIQRDK